MTLTWNAAPFHVKKLFWWLFFPKNWSGVHTHYIFITKHFPSGLLPSTSHSNNAHSETGLTKMVFAFEKCSKLVHPNRREMHCSLRGDRISLQPLEILPSPLPLWRSVNLPPSLSAGHQEHIQGRTRLLGGTPQNPLGCKFGDKVFLWVITTKNGRKWRSCWTMERSSSSQPLHDPDKSRSRDSGSNLAWAWVTAQMNCFNKSALVN